MKSSHKVGFDILNFKISFNSRINMNIFFNFVKILNIDYMLKVGLSRFMEIQSKLTIIMKKKYFTTSLVTQYLSYT
jgi:hypothetical protein